MALARNWPGRLATDRFLTKGLGTGKLSGCRENRQHHKGGALAYFFRSSDKEPIFSRIFLLIRFFKETE
jgi:hypothetical protein